MLMDLGLVQHVQFFVHNAIHQVAKFAMLITMSLELVVLEMHHL
jgi:hypothetical protein